MHMINLENVSFSWTKGEDLIQIPHFSVLPGEKLFIKGASGSGKTTLLSLISGIQVVDSGLLELRGIELKKLKDHERDTFRGDHMGYIYQNFNLIPWLSIKENIQCSLLFSKVKSNNLKKNVDEQIDVLLEELNLNIDPKQSARTLSIGQQQRVAVARALIGNPPLIIADEPSSALDSDVKLNFMNLLFKECEERDSTLLVVSHDGEMAKRFERIEKFEEINRGIK